MSTIIESTGSAREVLYNVGLSSPQRRFVAATCIAGVLLYALKTPPVSFKKDGTLKAFTPISSELETTYAHFLVFPLLVGLAAATIL